MLQMLKNVKKTVPCIELKVRSNIAADLKVETKNGTNMNR